MDFIYQGQKRSGKTKNAVSLIRKYLNQGRRVLTNIDVFPAGLKLSNLRAGLLIRIPDVPSAECLDCLGHAYLVDSSGHYLHTGERLSKIYQSDEVFDYNESFNGLIVIDEASLTFDARNWQDQNQKELLEWIIHSGKYGWDILYIVHDLTTIDKRIREQYINAIYVHRNFRDYFPPESRGWIPEFHIVSVYPSADKIGTRKGRISRRFFLKRGIQKAYDTRQRFVPYRLDVIEGTNVDGRSVYSILPAKYTKPIVSVIEKPKQSSSVQVHARSNKAGLSSIISLFLVAGFPLILFVFLIYYIYSELGNNEVVSNIGNTSKSQVSQLSNTEFDAKCSYENLISFTDVSNAKEKFDNDFLMQIFRYYNVEVSNLYDYAGRPAFTLLFKSPQDGRIVDSTTDKELLGFGWVAHYWGQGLMLINGNMWFFVKTELPKGASDFIDSLPISGFLR